MAFTAPLIVRSAAGKVSVNTMHLVRAASLQNLLLSTATSEENTPCEGEHVRWAPPPRGQLAPPCSLAAQGGISPGPGDHPNVPNCLNLDGGEVLEKGG